MHPRRLARLNELILQTVSNLLLNLKDPQIGFITTTGADVSADLSIARIYYSVLGTPAEKEATAQALERAKSYVRREVGRLENLRKVPEIIFVYDDTAERADRVLRLMNAIENERKKSQPDDHADN